VGADFVIEDEHHVALTLGEDSRQNLAPGVSVIFDCPWFGSDHATERAIGTVNRPFMGLPHGPSAQLLQFGCRWHEHMRHVALSLRRGLTGPVLVWALVSF
jgi:hypothetical protein